MAEAHYVDNLNGDVDRNPSEGDTPNDDHLETPNAGRVGVAVIVAPTATGPGPHGSPYAPCRGEGTPVRIAHLP